MTEFWGKPVDSVTQPLHQGLVSRPTKRLPGGNRFPWDRNYDANEDVIHEVQGRVADQRAWGGSLESRDPARATVLNRVRGLHMTVCPRPSYEAKAGGGAEAETRWWVTRREQRLRPWEAVVRGRSLKKRPFSGAEG